MNRNYKFFLNKDNKFKNILVFTYSMERARELIKEAYPDWEVSMFWVVWPYP
jgi:hypothetical protein